MTNAKFLVIAALVAVAPAAWAQQEADTQVTRAPGSVTIKGTRSVTATVQDIDRATRTVLLKGKNGKVVEVEVGQWPVQLAVEGCERGRVRRQDGVQNAGSPCRDVGRVARDGGFAREEACIGSAR